MSIHSHKGLCACRVPTIECMHINIYVVHFILASSTLEDLPPWKANAYTHSHKLLAYLDMKARTILTLYKHT